MKRMVKSRRRFAAASIVCGALALALCVAPTGALGWGGTPHAELADDVGQAFSPDVMRPRSAGYPFIERGPDLRPFAVIPEIDTTTTAKENGGNPFDEEVADTTYSMREILMHNAREEDSYDLVDNWQDYDWNTGFDPFDDEIPTFPLGEDTVTHFWDADVSITEEVRSGLGDEYPNAWFKSKILWNRAIDSWAAGDKGMAWMYLGHVLHILTDQGLAAHAHNDWHAPDDESMEDWFYGCTASLNLLYSWSDRPKMIECTEDGDPTYGTNSWPPPPGGVMLVPLSNDGVITALSAAGDWANDPDLFDTGAAKLRNLQQLFYLMYTVNQYGDFSPSDGDPPDPDGIDGDMDDVLSWASFNDGVIPHVNPETSDPLTGEDSGDTIVDAGDENANNNFGYILMAGWRAAFRAAPALIDLFRKTVDDVAPVSDVVATRADGLPVVQWNNSAVTVRITTETTDGARTEAGMPASGVWKLWGEVDAGVGPTEAADGSVYWVIATDGKHAVRPMSTDNMGNVEGPFSDFEIWVDQTPPEIAFPDLRPNYLTSEDFIPLWTATDVTSGIAEGGETAYLDGQLVDKSVPLDLALMAGRHTLGVYASDVAGNFRYEEYYFEVWIDTATFALPVVVNSRSGGEGLMVFVEFPVPYDLGAIELDTCMLRPGGTIDLTAPFPVVGGYYGSLPGEMLGGIADRDKDGLPERLIRFDRGAFLASFGGATGDVPAVVWGGLNPDGTPRFIGSVTVQLFTPPPK